MSFLIAFFWSLECFYSACSSNPIIFSVGRLMMFMSDADCPARISDDRIISLQSRRGTGGYDDGNGQRAKTQALQAF